MTITQVIIMIPMLIPATMLADDRNGIRPIYRPKELNVVADSRDWWSHSEVHGVETKPNYYHLYSKINQ